MDPNSFSISSPDIATPPEIAAGAFIYEPRSGRVFFFQKSISTSKDEDHRYCPVCGNLRKTFAQQEKGRQHLNALLTRASLEEIDAASRQGPERHQAVPAVATVAGRPSEPGWNQRGPTGEVAALHEDWQQRPLTRQQTGIFSRSQSRGPPSTTVALHDTRFIAALSATHLAGSPRLPERRAKP